MPIALYLKRYYICTVMAAIHVISPSEFKQNQKKFFDLALSERVVIKRGKDLFELVSKPYIDESISPSGDPFFNDPRNLQAIREAIEQAKRGQVTELTPELKEKLFGNL